MKTMTIEEQPIFVLEYQNYEYGTHLDVYVADLKNAKVGTVFTPAANTNCGRGIREESLKVVWKDDTGIAAVYSVCGTTDSVFPEDWEEEDTLIWFKIV